MNNVAPNARLDEVLRSDTEVLASSHVPYRGGVRPYLRGPELLPRLPCNEGGERARTCVIACVQQLLLECLVHALKDMLGLATPSNTLGQFEELRSE